MERPRLLYAGQFRSKDRTAGALAELFGTLVSAETVAAMTARAAPGTRTFLRELQAVLDHHARSGGEDSWCWAEQAADALRTMKGSMRRSPTTAR
ncbi:hypothetical protein [Actinomadura livida]|uniref:Transposase n=1 Tax=Actinomadura livida TaxID=79909 RepID=A0A7W7ICA6_9ACTN|nr:MULTISPECIES: hypothetical protein [Actinomadura]MBB4774452.1 hypothetical protein [Actinomadura catellatispora]GGT82444.1 hypothetical protein GCM10010208_00930 [Actinomadura livida]